MDKAILSEIRQTNQLLQAIFYQLKQMNDREEMKNKSLLGDSRERIVNAH